MKSKKNIKKETNFKITGNESSLDKTILRQAQDINLNHFPRKFNLYNNIHFVGIGGVSMSSLAVWSILQGYTVTGSDITISDITKELESMGIKIFYEHKQQNVINADLVVYSNATDNSCEVLYANMLGIKTASRAEFLAKVLKDYKIKICVSGAHGKTTTTALIYSILNQAKKQPSLHLGGNLCETGKTYKYSKKDYMVCEACEYKDAFLKLPATIGVILNIAPEHLDYFKDYKGVLNSFNQFALNSQNLVINYDFYNKNAIFFEKNELKNKKIITFGLTKGDFTADNVSLNCNGTYSFDCLKNREFYTHIALNLVGKHNVLNALAAIAVCDHLGIAKTCICAGLQNFQGVQRRFEYLHKTKFIVHDYAHHPDEIKAVLSETFAFYKSSKLCKNNLNILNKKLKNTPENTKDIKFKSLLSKQLKEEGNKGQKLLVVFQPHTYSRTKTLLKDFIRCFDDVQELVLLKTYSAREKYNYKGSACYLAKNIGSKAKYFGSKQKAKDFILQKIKDGYGVLFLGAGDIYTFAKIVAKLC